MTTVSPKKALVIIDRRVSDWKSLISGIDTRNTDVFVLDATKDGLTQIAQQIGNYSYLDAIHIISHGNAGNLLLGSRMKV